ncbi:MAG TPA: PAS domain S-box protein [Vicinamibacterales bacterium]|nr:PAS domain S-box protein [Vicinamibacterales bacterium]
MASPALKVDEAFPDEERLYETLLQAQSDMGDGLLIIEGHRIVYANDAAAQIGGWNVDELIAQSSVFDLIPMDEQRRLAHRLDRAASLERVRNHCESTIVSRDGRRVDLELSIQNVPTRGGRRVIVIARDITERKQMERTLRSSEARYRLLFDSTVAGLCVSTIEGRLIQCNTAFARMLGFATVDEALADPEADLDLASPDGGAILRGLRTRGAVTNFEIPLRRRDGARAWALGNATLLDRFDEGPTLVETILIDVTERRALQAQLHESQKMDAIGRLAGGVAHDFNNLLTAIQGYSELTLSDLGSHPLRVQIEEIRKAAQRAASLTRQLLAFSRRQEVAPVVLDLNTVVRAMHQMLRRLIGEDVELVSRLTEPLRRVKADQSQIEQVLMNLVVNARDAQPGGGTITIETDHVRIGPVEARLFPELREGHHVVLRVRDTGVGMTPEVQAHVFEPFFTTKSAGRGTGLGLSTVYGIVQQSGGHIRVDSEPGRGSVFSIYLPPTPDAEQVAGAGPVDVAPSFGTETVLVVEDDEEVRHFARRVLERQGYRVLEAAHAADALRLVESYAGPIHVLLTDVVMPKMNGGDLAARLRPIRPLMRVLYMSGYAEDELLNHGCAISDLAFLPKPFLPEALARRVRDLIDAEAAGDPRRANERH